MAVSLGLLSALASTAGAGHLALGAFGPEGPRLREQLWMLPSADPQRALRATVFRPEDQGGEPTAKRGDDTRRPLVVINHGSAEATRLAVAMPVYYWLSRWFVERGYVVVLPQRRGFGATGGPVAEAVGDCANPDHLLSGIRAADDIAAVIDYMTQQDFVRHEDTLVVGVSTGGWASLALAARNLPSVRGIVNFAGGRGGHAQGKHNKICGEGALIESAGAFGKAARTPTLWLYSENDSYFSLPLARAMAGAWHRGGGFVELQELPAYGDDGHGIADDLAGWDIWGKPVERFLATINPQATSGEAALAIQPSR